MNASYAIRVSHSPVKYKSIVRVAVPGDEAFMTPICALFKRFVVVTTVPRLVAGVIGLGDRWRSNILRQIDEWIWVVEKLGESKAMFFRLQTDHVMYLGVYT